MTGDSAPLPRRAEPGRIALARRGRDQAGWRRWLPGLRTLTSYESAWLRHDIVAGLVLTTMLVPVGIAYAVASGVPGIYGLYAFYRERIRARPVAATTSGIPPDGL